MASNPVLSIDQSKEHQIYNSKMAMVSTASFVKVALELGYEWIIGRVILLDKGFSKTGK